MKEGFQQITIDEYSTAMLKQRIREEQDRLKALLKKERERQIAEKKEKEARDLVYAQTALEVVSEYYGVSIEQMTSESRSTEFKQPRNTAQYIIFNGTTTIPLIRISELVGRTDHSTAINSIQRVERRLEYDGGLRARIGEMQEEIKRRIISRAFIPLSSTKT